MIFPGSAGVSPAPEAARMAALPGYKRQEHNGSKILSRYLAPGIGRMATPFSYVGKLTEAVQKYI
jgi:hypothetical protein